MLSALSPTPHTFYNTPSCSYDPSPFLPSFQQLTSSAMQARLQGSATHNATKSRPYIASPGNMFRVYGYTPQEGAAGTPIVVTVRFIFESTETTFLRIVVGNRALSTAVSASATGRLGEWDLKATAPDFEAATAGPLCSSTVPLTVQALDASNATLDSVTFGKFTYCTRASSVLLKREGRDDLSSFGSSSAPSTPDLRNSPPTLVARRTSRPTPGHGTVRARGINATMSPKDAQSARGHLKKQSLIRGRRSGSEDDDADSSHRAVLSMEIPTDPMGNYEDWDGDERRIGRRLVRFTRVQDGSTLHVACEAIKPAEYTDGDTVVSCIYRPADAAGPGEAAAASQCCITSVDIIFLLECLVGDIFNIEEKNRIRRNLEGFRPKTVSKNKAGTEEFFQKIMDFPAPKPRNIEKDVKVFDWTVLPQALDKIISKYTLHPNAKKQDGSATPPTLDNMGIVTSPLLSQSSIGISSASSSPVPDRAPAESPDQSYFIQQTTYRSHYLSPSLDPLDGGNNYVTATALSSASTYDSLFSHPHPSTQSSASSPMITPADSPLVSTGLTLPFPGAGDQFLVPSSSYTPSFAEQSGAFAPGAFFMPSFDSSRTSPPDLHVLQNYL